MQIHEIVKDENTGKIYEFPLPSSKRYRKSQKFDSQIIQLNNRNFNALNFIPKPNYIKEIYEPIRKESTCDIIKRKVSESSFIKNITIFKKRNVPYISKVESVLSFIYRNFYPFDIFYKKNLKAIADQAEKRRLRVFASLECNLNLLHQYEAKIKDIEFITNPRNTEMSINRKKETCETLLKCYLIEQQVFYNKYYRKLQEIGD